jgi:zinc transport system substrate-binding protein
MNPMDRPQPFPSVGRRVSLSLLFLAFFFPFFGNHSYAQAQAKVKVVTTLFPLQEFARMVGGERAQVDLLLPPGAEPHEWEPKPGDLARIYKADVFIFIGPAMEPWAHDLLKAAQKANLRVVEALKGLPLLEAGESPREISRERKSPAEERVDPHVWLDFSLDLKIIEAIAAAFGEKDPAHASEYQANAAATQARLSALDQKYKSGLARCGRRQMVLGGHSAFAYLAKRYDLRQIPLYGVSPNAEPSPKKLAEVITSAKNHGVKYIFFEELVNPKLARVLAREAGIQTLSLSDGANLTREQVKQRVTFFDLMERNLEHLRKGLECEP